MFIRKIESDIPVLYKDVPTFPLGIKDAFDELYSHFAGRHFYGISHMDDAGNVIYKAAAAGSAVEAAQYGYDAFTIPAGDWLAEKVTDWMSKIDSFKDIFGQLMQDARYDPTVDCVEWYIDDVEMLIMVKCR